MWAICGWLLKFRKSHVFLPTQSIYVYLFRPSQVNELMQFIIMKRALSVKPNNPPILACYTHVPRVKLALARAPLKPKGGYFVHFKPRRNYSTFWNRKKYSAHTALNYKVNVRAVLMNFSTRFVGNTFR